MNFLIIKISLNPQAPYPIKSFPPTLICSGGWYKGKEMAMLVAGCGKVHLADAQQNYIL